MSSGGFERPSLPLSPRSTPVCTARPHAAGEPIRPNSRSTPSSTMFFSYIKRSINKLIVMSHFRLNHETGRTQASRGRDRARDRAARNVSEPQGKKPDMGFDHPSDQPTTGYRGASSFLAQLLHDMPYLPSSRLKNELKKQLKIMGRNISGYKRRCADGLKGALEDLHSYLTFLNERRRATSWLLAAQEKDRVVQFNAGLDRALSLFTTTCVLSSNECLRSSNELVRSNTIQLDVLASTVKQLDGGVAEFRGTASTAGELRWFGENSLGCRGGAYRYVLILKLQTGSWLGHGYIFIQDSDYKSCKKEKQLAAMLEQYYSRWA
ncbi:hypothetical protein C8J57DRAFT_1239945 [Mycena rebaudengoi]|nr:hypothetical protein C8J57DRAFT_1239945 [Mycena rebaudengoi]